MPDMNLNDQPEISNRGAQPLRHSRQPLETSRVNIVPSGTNAVLKWPVDSLGYKVQATTNLAPAVWVNVINAQFAVSGQFNVTAPANGSTKFYRLIQQ
jgi:hypothetical protein